MSFLSGVTSKISKSLQGSQSDTSLNHPSPIYGFTFAPFSLSTSDQKTSGSASSETSGATVIDDDRDVRIKLNRKTPEEADAACVWAYDNDYTVFKAVQKRINAINNGLDIVYTGKKSEYNDEEFQEFKKKYSQKIDDLLLSQKIDSMLVMKYQFGFGILRKQVVDGDILRLVELDSKQCYPIRNLQTNELGGEIGKGLDPNRLEVEVALVQKGLRVQYTAQTGVPLEYLQYYYFTRDEIIPFSNSDRGRFKGTSVIRRVLRLVEIKKAIENTIDFLVRRFGPQIWLTIGNADMNLTKTEIPSEYLVDSNSNPVDIGVARANYKAAIFRSIETSVQGWADSDTLTHLAEYGIDPKMFNPSSGIMDYSKYINVLENAIELAIVGIDIPNRVDVTSGKMQNILPKDLKEIAKKERDVLEVILNKEVFSMLIAKDGKTLDYARLAFKPFDQSEDEQDALIEKNRSETVYNYAKAGYTKIPDDIKMKWNLGSIEDSMVTISEQKSYLKQKLQSNPIDKTSKTKLNDLNKDR